MSDHTPTPEGDSALAQLLSKDPFLGMYAPDGAEAPSGYTEVRDANGHRVFLNNQVLREVADEGKAITVGKLMGTPGTPDRDGRHPTIQIAAGAQDDISVKPAHLFSTKRHPATPGLDGNQDPAGPDPQEA